jgi:glycerate kinase
VRVVVAPDKMRGSLTAPAFAAALAAGLARSGHEVRQVPLADGGEGFAAALVAAAGGELVPVDVVDALGAPITATLGLLPGGVAVVETALAVGLELLGDRRDPVGASTRGAGLLIAAALDAGAREVLVGVGGSATTDGGLGALDALGWDLRGARVRVACDVRTTFVDAARVFGPQKGATPQDVTALTARLAALVGELTERTGRDVRDLPGSGAAGGLAGGLAALGASLEPGFDLVAEAVRLDDAIAAADAVVSGEGRLDATSLQGKVVGEVLARAAAGGVSRRVVVAGAADDDVRAALVAEGVEVSALTDLADDTADAISRAGELVEQVAARLLGG